MFYFILAYLCSVLHTKLFYKDYIEAIVRSLENKCTIDPKKYNIYCCFSLPIKVLYYSFLMIQIYNFIGKTLYSCIFLSFMTTYYSKFKTTQYNRINFLTLWIIGGLQLKHFEQYGFSAYYFLQILRYYSLFKLHIISYNTIYAENNKNRTLNHSEAYKLKVKRILVK